MSGIIMGALGGLGAGAQQVGQNLNASAMQDQQAQNAQNLAELQADLALQKENAAAQFRAQLETDTANQRRMGMINNIANAKQQIVDQKMQDTYGDYDAAAAGTPNSGTPLTPDQQSVIQQAQGTVQGEKATDLASLANDPETYLSAAMNSGYIDPARVAEIAQQKAALQMQSDMQDDRFEHDDNARADSQRFEAGQAAASRTFQSGENQKARDAEMQRYRMMYGDPSNVTDAEKQNWVSTYIRSNGTVPRSAPAIVRNSVGTWAAQMGITPDDIAKGTAQSKYDQSAASAAGHRGGGMAVAEKALPALADQAVDLVGQLNNGDFVPMNKLVMMADNAISNPVLARLKVAHQGLVSEYQTVIARGGTNVTALKEAGEALNNATSPQAYAQAADQIKREVEINANASDSVRNSIGGNTHSAGRISTVPNPVSNTSGDGWGNLVVH